MTNTIAIDIIIINMYLAYFDTFKPLNAFALCPVTPSVALVRSYLRSLSSPSSRIKRHWTKG